jgi:FtsP/CotA-like multicopper oxidase with cupredoxin domain
MPMLLTRRQILSSGAAVTGAISLSPPGRAAAPEGAANLRVTAETRTLVVNGRAARVFGLIGPGGKPGLTLSPGERFRVDFANQCGEASIIHWHGQTPPWKQDGFPWPQTPPIPVGETRAYDYAPIAGTYWMHSHQGLQEQSLMTAPLIVHSAEDERDDRQEVVLMLHDFSFRSPEEILAGLMKSSSSAMPGGAGQGANMASSTMGGVDKAPAKSMDLNDVDFDAFLANDRTLADPEVIRVERGGRVRLRVINAAASTQFWVDLGALTGTIVAVDGHPIRPVGASVIPISMAQRVDVLIELPGEGAYPILAQAEGEKGRAGIVLATAGAVAPRIAAEAEGDAPPVDMSLERQLEAATPLARRAADVTHKVILAGGMAHYSWSLNDEYWPNATPLMVAAGQRVEIEMVNRSMMAHPMHLHGHAFQVTGLNREPIAGAVRDTVVVPALGSVTIAFDADNPGRWPFHCHNLYHLATGMMTEVRYPGIV